MAIVVIKDSEKNNPRFKERRSKRINDQVDIITESELGKLLVQDQAPVSESIQTAINSDRTVVAHFMLGHKKKIYQINKNVYGINAAGIANFGTVDINNTTSDGTEVSTGNEFLTATIGTPGSIGANTVLPFWGTTNASGLNSFIYNMGYFRDMRRVLSNFGDYNPFANDISINGFAIDEMYIDKNVIKNIGITPKKVESITSHVRSYDDLGGLSGASLSVLNNPKASQTQNQTATAQTNGVVDASSGGVFVGIEFNAGTDFVVDTFRFNASESEKESTLTDGVTNWNLIREGKNIIDGTEFSGSNNFFEYISEIEELSVKRTRDFRAGYRYFFEVKKHTIPALEYAQNRTFIEYSNSSIETGNIVNLMATVKSTLSTLTYDGGFATTKYVSNHLFLISSTANTAPSGEIRLGSGDVWNMKSGAYVSSILPAKLPNELSVNSFRIDTQFNPSFEVGGFITGSPAPETYTLKDVILPIYEEKADLSQYGLSSYIDNVTSAEKRNGFSAPATDTYNAFGSINMRKFTTMAGLEFLFAMSGRSDVNDASYSAIVTRQDTATDVVPSVSSPSYQSGTAAYTFTDRFGNVRTVFADTGSGTSTAGTPKVFNAYRASTAAEIYEVKILRYPAETIEISSPIYGPAANQAYGDYAAYGGYGAYGTSEPMIIGYDTFLQNEVSAATLAGVPFSLSNFAAPWKPIGTVTDLQVTTGSGTTQRKVLDYSDEYNSLYKASIFVS
jgi:hypothetical protein